MVPLEGLGPRPLRKGGVREAAVVVAVTLQVTTAAMAAMGITAELEIMPAIRVRAEAPSLVDPEVVAATSAAIQPFPEVVPVAPAEVAAPVDVAVEAPVERAEVAGEAKGAAPVSVVGLPAAPAAGEEEAAGEVAVAARAEPAVLAAAAAGRSKLLPKVVSSLAQVRVSTLVEAADWPGHREGLERLAVQAAVVVQVGRVGMAVMAALAELAAPVAPVATVAPEDPAPVGLAVPSSSPAPS